MLNKTTFSKLSELINIECYILRLNKKFGNNEEVK
jgi:hypothetical protein